MYVLAIMEVKSSMGVIVAALILVPVVDCPAYYLVLQIVSIKMKMQL
jgi:hypothetical protein